jgi:hypothetical protein
MTTMSEALADLGWSEELIEAFTAKPHFSVSTPTINVSITPSIREQTNLVVDQATPMLASGATLFMRHQS